jgi:hypothetical protein
MDSRQSKKRGFGRWIDCDDRERKRKKGRRNHPGPRPRNGTRFVHIRDGNSGTSLRGATAFSIHT